MDVMPPEDGFRPTFGRVEQRDEMRLVRYHAFLGEATLLLPLGTAFFAGIWLLLAPTICGRMAAGTPTPLGGLLVVPPAWRLPIAIGLAVLVAVILAALRSPRVEDAFCRSDWLPLLGKFVLFLPLVGGVALLLLSVLTPLMTALSTVP